LKLLSKFEDLYIFSRFHRRAISRQLTGNKQTKLSCQINHIEKSVNILMRSLTTSMNIQ
jgi:hypothetical protein